MIGGTITKLGVVLVVAGALLMAGPAFGFSSLAADRGVNVDTAENQHALLGVVDSYDGDLITNHPPGQPDEIAEVIELTNNANSDFTAVDVEVDGIVGDDDAVLEVVDAPSSLSATDEDVPVELGCSGITEGDGQTDVSLRIDAIGSPLSITDMIVVIEDVQYDCREDGSAPPAEFTYVSGSATTEGSDLTFEFENVGQEAITLDEVGVSSDIAGADKILNRDGNIVVINPKDGVDGSVNEDDGWQGSYEADGTLIAFDESPEIDSGAKATVTIEAFGTVERGGGPPRFVAYEFEGITDGADDIVVTLVTEDGEEAEFAFGES